MSELLQQAGIPAGELLTALESIENAHYLARGFRVEIDQPGVPGERILLDGPGFYGSRMAPARITATPLVGEHTREVQQSILYGWVRPACNVCDRPYTRKRTLRVSRSEGWDR